MLQDVSLILLRDLDALRREVDLYPDDESPWVTIPGTPNTGGTLVLHLVGNLRHFVGAALGRSGFVRDRDAEFSTRGVTRRDLASAIDVARRDVADTLARLDEGALATTFPLAVGGHSFTTARFLLHLVTHLAYHLGQVDYHRRTVTGSGASAAAMSLGPLALEHGQS